MLALHVVHTAARRVCGMDLVYAATNRRMGKISKQNQIGLRTKALNKLADGVLNRLYVK